MHMQISTELNQFSQLANLRALRQGRKTIVLKRSITTQDWLHGKLRRMLKEPLNAQNILK